MKIRTTGVYEIFAPRARRVIGSVGEKVKDWSRSENCTRGGGFQFQTYLAGTITLGGTMHIAKLERITRSERAGSIGIWATTCLPEPLLYYHLMAKGWTENRQRGPRIAAFHTV